MVFSLSGCITSHCENSCLRCIVLFSATSLGRVATGYCMTFPHFKDFLPCFNPVFSLFSSPPTRFPPTTAHFHLTLPPHIPTYVLFFSIFLHHLAVQPSYEMCQHAALPPHCHAIWMNQTQSTQESVDGRMPRLRGRWINYYRRAVTRSLTEWRSGSRRAGRWGSCYAFELVAPRAFWIIHFDECRWSRSKSTPNAPWQDAQILVEQMAKQQRSKDAAVAPNFELKLMQW